VKQFIIIDDYEVRIQYGFKTWVYDLDCVKAMHLHRENKKIRYWHILGLYTITIISIFFAMHYTLLYTVPIISGGLILYITPAQPYDYFIVVDVNGQQSRIKIKAKDKFLVLKDITSFLNYHFVYKTFNAIANKNSMEAIAC